MAIDLQSQIKENRVNYAITINQKSFNRKLCSEFLLKKTRDQFILVVSRIENLKHLFAIRFVKKLNKLKILINMEEERISK